MSGITKDSIIGHLRQNGMRITLPRQRILDVLFEAKSPLSIQDIQDRTTHRRESPDFATVFRVISLLERLRFIHKVEMRRAKPYYELSNRHNDHLVCKTCGKVISIEDCPVKLAAPAISRRYKFKIASHSVIFFGECSDCQAST